MYARVLVPTDGSDAALAAARRAVGLARTLGAELHALGVVDTGAEPEELSTDDRREVRDVVGERAHEATMAVQDLAEDTDVTVVREIREGRPARAVLDYVDETDVDLVVMGARGGGAAGPEALGSTTRRVLALASVPVIVDPGSDVEPVDARGVYETVLVATDGSDAAGVAAGHGLAIAERTGAGVHAVYVVDTGTYGYDGGPRSIVGLLKEGGRGAVDSVATDAADRGLASTTAVLRGAPVDVVLQYARSAAADLVVVGSRGVSGSEDAFLGSTTERLAALSPVPVLAAR